MANAQQPVKRRCHVYSNSISTNPRALEWMWFAPFTFLEEYPTQVRTEGFVMLPCADSCWKKTPPSPPLLPPRNRWQLLV